MECLPIDRADASAGFPRIKFVGTRPRTGNRDESHLSCLLAAVRPLPLVHADAVDWLAIALYFSILLGVAWWVIRKSKDTAADYFLAGRNLGWWVIGASIFASNIGSEHVVGLAGSGAKDGVAMAHYELHAWCLLVLAWVFVPFYARSMVFTMPEFLERRFSPASRYVLSIVSLITFVVSKIAVGIFAGGVVFSLAAAGRAPAPRRRCAIDSFWIGSVLVIVLTGLYTMLGGMRAVAYNDAVQTVVLIAGSALLTIYGLSKLGGWGELRAHLRLRHVQPLETADPAAASRAPGRRCWKRTPPARSSARRGTSTATFPGWAWPFCAPVIGLWYWCTDQYIVQRALGAPNETDRPARQHLRRLPEAVSRLSVHHPRPDLLRLGQERQGAGTGRSWPRRQGGSPRGPGRLSHDGQAPVAAGPARHRRGRPALGADGLAGRRVQRLLHALYRGPVREVEAGTPRSTRSSAWAASPPP